jgi:molecular chaperone DnaK
MNCGIDFGTRNTAIVKGERRVTGVSGNTIPSFVAYSRMGLPRRIGETAKDLLGDPALATDWDVERSFKVRLVDGVGGLRTPMSVTADFLSDALRLPSAGGEPVTRAIMAIPVAWPPTARAALRRAALQAGIPVSGFVSESTAAFARHRDNFGAVQQVAVFDWGAGTLDISVLRIRGGLHGARSIEELRCASSDSAGDAVDDLLAQHLHRQLQIVDPRLPAWEEVDRADKDRLRHQAELAKMALSGGRPPTAIPITLARYCGGIRNTSLSIRDFESAVEPVINSAVRTLQEALKRAEIAIETGLDVLLVVGGSSKLRGLEARLRETFGDKLFMTTESDWDVAEGAKRIAEAGEGCYTCVQEFHLVLSDGLSLPLTQPGAPFDGRPSGHVVGKVDESPVASLVFGERPIGTHRAPIVVGGLTVPSQGLPGEPIEIEARLDPDLFLRVEAWPMLGLRQVDQRIFEFPHTRFEYRL